MVVTKQIVLLDLLNHLLSEMGLFTLHTYCVSCLLDYLKSLVFDLFPFQRFMYKNKINFENNENASETEFNEIEIIR